MKLIDGGEPLEFEPRLDGDHYIFPCGCKFRVLDEPLVHGHLPIILDRNMTLDCPLVWKMLGEGVTAGVFQLESRLGKTYAMKLKPTSIDHLAALVAILRPGALRAKTEEGVTLTDLYCMRKNGLAEVNIDIEAIREILEPTYDCMLYQEQTMFIAKILCDFTSMEIDALRAAIGKKKMDKLVEIGKVFVDRAEAKGLVTRAKAEALFEQIKKSGAYQFNRSHSVTYAYGTYESAFFKCHFPVYFYTSYLDGAQHKIDPQQEVKNLIRDARRFGIPILTPQFTDLEEIFSTDNIQIRFGLSNLKGVGSKVVGKMREKLDKSQLLNWSWYDYLTLGSNACGATAVRHMIQGGAMNYGLQRQRMLAEYEAWSGLTATEQGNVIALGNPLYKKVPVFEKQTTSTEIDGKIRKKTLKVKVDEVDEMVDEARPVSNLEQALQALLDRPGAVTKNRREKVATILSLLQNPPYPLVDTDHLIAKNEQELLGVAITTQALAKVDRSILNCTLKEFIAGKSSYEYVIGVEVVEVFERTVKNGDNRGARMASLTVTDGENTLDDVVVFPDAWEQYGLILMRPGAVVALCGRRNNKNPMGFVVDKVLIISA